MVKLLYHIAKWNYWQAKYVKKHYLYNFVVVVLSTVWKETLVSSIK